MAAPYPAPPDRETLVHATAVAIDGRAVLISGTSGSGKSDLALRLIDRGAVLVSDDQVAVRLEAGIVIARAPAMIAGRMEVRGVGVVEVRHAAEAPVVLWVELGQEAERMPEGRMRSVVGSAVPAITVDPRPASAPIKVEWALRHLAEERT